MAYDEKQSCKAQWYYAPAFLLIWVVLLFAVIIPIFLTLPDGLTVENEYYHQGEFIAERAERLLFDFDSIGPKVVGSNANENLTVQFLLKQLEEIKSSMQHDLFEMDVDVQLASGSYIHWSMVNMYQGVQNVVVRFKANNVTSQSYLLLNSHFDSKPGSPGAGDDGTMVVVMLEVIRVLATTRQTFVHPIVFLFNGAEENPLQGSHGFITQHKWAKNCKVLINLDSAGSGNREMLFQSGPNHPWLINIYSKYVKWPHTTTFAEELFHSNVVPSDTDFRIFKNFGNVPGLDFAHTYNGYVYHTKFDRSKIIPRGTLQATGDNILALARAFADAPELEDPTAHTGSHTVFYDFLGFFVVYYTEGTGKMINTFIALAAMVLVGISMWFMARNSFMPIEHIWHLFALVLALHFLGFILAYALPLLVAVIYDSFDRTLTWFTNIWLIFGIYICPTLLGLSAPTMIYLSCNRNDKVPEPYRLQMVGHAHTLILAILCIMLSCFGIRSSYFLMLSLLFHVCSLIINLITTLHRRAYYWTIFIMLSQIVPFIYVTYQLHSLLCSFVPMMGRFTSVVNPDLCIATMTATGILLSMGYLIPLLNIFKRTKLVFLILPGVTFIFVLLTLTPLGFPYRAETNVGRVNLMEVRRVFYEYDGSVSRNESGYYFDFEDRRKHLPIEDYVDLREFHYLSADCDEYMMCGMPVFAHRGAKSRREAGWLPRQEPIELPGTPRLTLSRKTANISTQSVRFDFELDGPPHMGIFIQPLDKVSVSDWSFGTDMLQQRDKYEPPYHIHFSYGKVNTPLQFYIDLKRNDEHLDVSLMELGISAHYISFEHMRDAETKEFLSKFPDYIYVLEWPSSYERYIF